MGYEFRIGHAVLSRTGEAGTFSVDVRPCSGQTPQEIAPESGHTSTFRCAYAHFDRAQYASQTYGALFRRVTERTRGRVPVVVALEEWERALPDIEAEVLASSKASEYRRTVLWLVHWARIALEQDRRTAALSIR
ncbi:hypothetical protein HNR42_001305 [Deinobacterium chartae]|uniref:Uncharacterized protein n=1 Tax=Deinobacterium chartae TaxID=521158 RepID=A0A841I1D5_9DEIO|nr:hypothetical protein [Deinobacterium chartae]MBB6097882.1 hypothetical protein [Deinobacterium chartae]